MWAHGQAPQPRSGAPKALEGRAHIHNIILAIAITFLFSRSCVCLSRGFVPIQGEPFACVRHSPHQLISGPVQPGSKVPHAHCEGAGLQGGWDHSLPRRLSALSRTGHTSTLDLINSFSIGYLIFVRHPLKTAPFGTRPVSRYRHNATSSLRANATMAMRRMRPFMVPTRDRNQMLKSLSG